ncbi:MAG TPA: twin-arginine translocase TatA/TatE family subunit [Acidimicrobiia bacterium]|nr:twin-arginine translocase TatA/TatE family subunit [Acidimicrobiia bacterium]
MFNLGPFELVAIFVVALLVFGPDKLPEMGRQVGRAVKEFRKFQASMQTQVRDVIDPITGPMNTSNGPLVNPQATNIRGTIPTETPNVPRSATIQDPAADEGGDADPPGTFGHYAPVDPPSNGGAATPSPGAVSTGDSPEPPTPSAGSADPDAG